MNPVDLPIVSTVVSAATAAVGALADLLVPFAGDAATALAVVLATLAVRAVLVPVGVVQARAERDRRLLAPAVADLQRRHRRDPQRLQRELAALYARAGVSPLTGCLPLLAQAPVLSLVYAVFASPTVAGAPNTLFSATLAGVPLGERLAPALVADPATAAIVLAVALASALVGTALLARRRILRDASTVAAPAPGATLALSWAPFTTVVVAAVVPLAAAVYVTVTALWTATERPLLQRFVAGGATAA